MFVFCSLLVYNAGMQSELEYLTAEPLDAATIAAVQIGIDQMERGEFVTLEQSEAELERFMAECEKIAAEMVPA